MLRPLVEKQRLDRWEKIVNFTEDGWPPSRLSFGMFKGRIYQEAREDAELRSWLEWLAEPTNERSSAMGRCAENAEIVKPGTDTRRKTA